ncbi:MAG: ABC transporter ATP-binding protein [Clostridia bacterium]|nr:ABC transporter ATP-binding protein [Clostridia bacterium]
MIEISHLSKKFGNHTALDDISFSVEKGEVVGFLGPNGAGKSTTLNILTGYLSSTSGTVRVGGIDVLENPNETKRLVGFLPEQPPLYPDMKVGEYLGFLYELKKCTLNREAHLREVAEVTKIADVENRLIKNLSKGYRQRIGIAAALIGNPPVIILDEPTVGLDPKQVIEIRNLIRNLGRTHTVILSSHILSEVQSVCDRIVIINEGRIVANERADAIMKSVGQARGIKLKVAGPQREVLPVLRAVAGVAAADITSEREADAYTYRLEAADGADIRRPVFFAMAEHGWAILSMEPVSANLEDIFIRVTAEDDKQRRRAAARS